MPVPVPRYIDDRPAFWVGHKSIARTLNSGASSLGLATISSSIGAIMPRSRAPRSVLTLRLPIAETSGFPVECQRCGACAPINIALSATRPSGLLLVNQGNFQGCTLVPLQ